jgi:anthranilate synthase component 1
VVNGAFGYISWDAIEFMENIEFRCPPDPDLSIPKARFMVFRYVMAFNHFRNEVHILENRVEGEHNSESAEDFVRAAFERPVRTYPFRARDDEASVLSDEEFLALLSTCKKHIARGDVFEIVPSRRYLQRFEGDDFQVYRALRSINPSPYLFYCDFGGYKLLGSSPEAQIVIRDGEAAIFPIAGTYPRTGNDEHDRIRAQQLLEDPKENAEHCMLVDLARNDLSRHCKNVRVTKYRETQFFSHVIHLVSQVMGTLTDPKSACQIVSDTFPAGTLSGAPKHRAMQILDQNEPVRRGHYGGCLGLLGFNGDVVLGIMIRSFLSIQDTLVYQAGMGVVHDSIPESELNEAHAKLAALRAAIRKAQEI